MMSVILHCPALGRDLSALRQAVPDAMVWAAPLVGGYRGCTMGHQAIVQMALAAEWPAVWVLEDDCQFTAAFGRARWEADVAWAFAHGYTFVVGGSVSTKRPRVVREGLVAVDRFKSAHCLAIHRDAYAVVLAVEEGPFDKPLGKFGKAVVTWPFVAVQAPGYSSAQGRRVDATAEFATYEAVLGELPGVAA